MAATGIILYAHGSSDPCWHEAVEAIAAAVRARAPATLVRCAYLERSTPDLMGAASELIAAGAGAIRVLPLLLGAGRHLHADIPCQIEAVRRAHPATALHLLPMAGEYAQVHALLADIALNG
ncbi:MAG: CbiX/SirB N-terminal domain-containing protein [Burkholderiaceae bacterium]|jgi:sirohydrochlorin cobaltochelatase|nr:CbiX/SirB N-terminal domain-containing protein [Burkholderiaceae bacterium]